MFGIVRPCRHRLREPLFGLWMAHLCGLCLTLRDLHGQSARLVTNYDALLVSVLTEAQDPGVTPHRTAGPCALRGLRRADVLDAAGAGARLAATVSLVLAAGKVRDHVEDRDGPFASRIVASGASRVASRWLDAGERTAAILGVSTAVLTDAMARQSEIERSQVATLLDVTKPTETAVGAAFAQTALLAGRPANEDKLAIAGRHFGRIAHLLDAVEDLPKDTENGSYNPLTATGTSLTRAHAHCSDALAGLRTAVADLDLAEPALTTALLDREVAIAVDKIFAEAERASATAPVGSVGRPGPTLGLPACVVSCRRRRDPRWPGRPRRRCGDRCSECGCDACCDGCTDCCEAADCCSACCDCSG